MTVRYGMVGGGPGAFIGGVHRIAPGQRVRALPTDSHETAVQTSDVRSQTQH